MGTQLFARALDALELVAIATGQIREPFVSPDGQWVGFVEGGSTLKKVAISGGPLIRLATLDGAPQGATWLPDDTIVVATNNRGTGLQRVPANGGTPTVVTRPDRFRTRAPAIGRSRRRAARGRSGRTVAKSCSSSGRTAP